MKEYINILCVLDRSGSMSTIINDSISGFNFFLEEQKKVEGKANMSIMLFDTEFLKSKLKSIQKIEKFTRKTYVPRGATALYDAIGITIDDELDRLSNLTKNKRPIKTLCVILTDGEENSSVNYDKNLIKQMITEMREEFEWEFIFLGANQDAILTADGLGISKGNTINFDATSDGITVAYASMNKAASHYRASTETNYDIFEETEK